MQTTHKFGWDTDVCACGARLTEVQDNIKSACCPNATDPKLIERIARAMCKADGNDPDDIGHKGPEFIHHGFASDWTRPHHPEQHYPLWAVYRGLAETAIIKLEASVKRMIAGGFDHLERMPTVAELDAILNSEDDHQVSITADGRVVPYDPNLAASVAKDTMLRALDAGDDLPNAIGKAAAHFFNEPALKDAPLIEAIRRDREKNGF